MDFFDLPLNVFIEHLQIGLSLADTLAAFKVEVSDPLAFLQRRLVE
jgi:hypothetical protein